MPKLRNAKTEIGKFTQWLGRKCRNHNPLEELKLEPRERAARPSIYRAKSKGGLRILGDNTLYYEAGNRIFRIVVDEITDSPDLLTEMESASEGGQLMMVL